MIFSISKDKIEFKDEIIRINGDMFMNPSGYESLDQMQEDVANIYIIAEYSGNFALLHVVSAFSEQEAVDNCIDVDYSDVLSIEDLLICEPDLPPNLLL